MDKFAKDAFKKAEQQRRHAEASAWEEIPVSERLASVATSLLMTGPEIAKVLDFVMKNGLEEVFHIYENFLMMGGFSIGFKSGQRSMLNNE